MKRISLYWLFICFAVSSALASAEGGDPIVFERILHHFGSIPEDGQSPVCVFRFKNTGSSSVAIAHVQTTCGCAVAAYSKVPVRAGDTGEISVVYNPQGRPGKFSRTIIVNFSGRSQPFKLTITGEVIPGAVRKYQRYPHVMGELQLKTVGLRFGPMRGEEQEQSVQVINSGNAPLRILVRSVDANLTVKAEPNLLLPDAVGEIIITRRAGKDRMETKSVRLLPDAEGGAKDGQVTVVIMGQ